MTLKLEERKIKLFFFQCSVRGSAGQKGPPPYAECTSPQPTSICYLSRADLLKRLSGCRQGAGRIASQSFEGITNQERNGQQGRRSLC
jgi:hypothetical protein